MTGDFADRPAGPGTVGPRLPSPCGGNCLNRGGRGNGGFKEHRYFVKETGYPGAKSTFRDISGDGKADYVVVYDGGSVRAWLNRGGNT
ncbi:hypothetical protein ACFQVC_40155 [Streptomyces monticola]|uniref:VCBS repeat-containing protein n=1 Tax=Streptomyces monticola TaxID=2666263 RepID=A0ABW2JY22_9ACTN